MQFNRKALITAMVVTGFSAGPAMAQSPATVKPNEIQLGMVSQDGESGYRAEVSVGRNDTWADGGPTKHGQLMERAWGPGGGSYSRLQLGAGWGYEPDAQTHWELVEIGLRLDRFATTINYKGYETVEDDSDAGYYVASDYETWWDNLGVRGRVQYADVHESAGFDLRMEGLYRITNGWQLTASYEVVGAGLPEEDILAAGVRFGW